VLTKKQETALEEIIIQRRLYLDLLPFVACVESYYKLSKEIERLKILIRHAKYKRSKTS
jgi:hypothetical protein